jgi:hypothetical protein
VAIGKVSCALAGREGKVDAREAHYLMNSLPAKSRQALMYQKIVGECLGNIVCEMDLVTDAIRQRVKSLKRWTLRRGKAEDTTGAVIKSGLSRHYMGSTSPKIARAQPLFTYCSSWNRGVKKIRNVVL